LRVLTLIQAKRIAAERGQHFETVVGAAAKAAYEGVRVLRRELRGEERERWDTATHATQQKWVARAGAVGLGEIRDVRGLYGRVMHLEDGDALTLAWEGVMDWRLLELAVELATLRFVMGAVLPEAVGPVLSELRRPGCV